MDVYWLILEFCNVSTIVLCLILKVPQIWNIISTRSVQGLSVPGILLELSAFSIGLIYNIYKQYPLFQYLEYPFLVLQDVLLLAIVLHFSKQLGLFSVAGFALYGAVLYAMSTGMFPPTIIVTLMSLCTPIAAMSKLAQLRAMHASQNSESVSVLTWSIAAYTCITRITTTVARSIDVPLLANYGVSLLLNLAIIWFALYLRSPKKPSTKKD